jgi:hypothetical protein
MTKREKKAINSKKMALKTRKEQQTVGIYRKH